MTDLTDERIAEMERDAKWEISRRYHASCGRGHRLKTAANRQARNVRTLITALREERERVEVLEAYTDALENGTKTLDEVKAALQQKEPE